MKSAWATLRGRGLAVHGIGIANFAAFLACFFVLIHRYFPAVGHDYHSFFSELLEGKWQFHHFGLAIPRYALHLCGGSVLYGNPQDMYYSLAQLLALVLGPWPAIQLAVLVSMVAGYVGWYRVGRALLGLPTPWSHVLALVVLSNGFYFAHVAAGHVTFHAFALLGWFFLLLFERTTLPLRALVVSRASAFALLCAYVLYSGNWIVLLYLAMGFCLVLPLDIYLSEFRRDRLVQLAVRCAIFGAAALAIMGSKLVAIYSFMRFFPRESPIMAQDPTFSALWYIAKALWGIPQSGQLLATMAPSYVHEKTVLISPVTWIGLVIGLVLLVRSIRKSTGKQRVSVLVFAAVYGGAVLLAMIQLVRGYGWVAEAFHRLPVGASQRASSRYLYLLSLVLSLAGVWSLAKAMANLKRTWNILGMVVASLATVAAFVFGYGGMMSEFGFWPNANDHRELWWKFNPSIPVTRVVEGTDFVAGTGRTCYEPVLNAAGDPFSVLHTGPVSDQDSGFFDLMNPACYQYPNENHCKPGDRISIGDGDNLRRFTTGLPVTWEVSRAQQVADLVSAFSLVVLTLAPWYGRRLSRRPS